MGKQGYNMNGSDQANFNKHVKGELVSQVVDFMDDFVMVGE